MTLSKTNNSQSQQMAWQISGEKREHLASWQSVCTEANAYSSPADVLNETTPWHNGLSPWAAQTIANENREHHDFWCRTRFTHSSAANDIQTLISFEGLATYAEVWLNGFLIFDSNNMFITHAIDVEEYLQDTNELVICHRALAPKLDQRKPRPAWRTGFVDHKNLHWFRTSLLGRIPTWSLPPPIIGPWAPIDFIVRKSTWIEDIAVTSEVVDKNGSIHCRVILSTLGKNVVKNICLKVGDNSTNLKSTHEAGVFEATLSIEDVNLWWPHTHGEPALYPVRVQLQSEDESIFVQLPQIGFHQFHWRDLNLALDSQRHSSLNFGLSVNGTPIFCRGACWTPIDSQQPYVTEVQLREQLLLLRDAGVNLLRISGTFVYEQPAFYRLCDELGILVWQDFMFARLPYPFDDPDFLATVKVECQQVIQRLSTHPSLVMFCGNTEVSQQAAMLGLQEPLYIKEFFQNILPQWCKKGAPHIAYCPSSPFGGERPFSISQGVAHYFGVGGYQKPLEDAQRHTPSFASECLAFSHVPEARGLSSFLPGQAAYPTHPDYKSGVPRDVNSGWDFADVTDFYLELLFKCNSRELRYQDPQRYYYLAKVATGEVSAKVFQYWRQEASGCNGGLIWFLRDLVKGAGWGIIDSEGYPKASYYYLKRQWASQCIWFVDDGLEGLKLNLAVEKVTESKPLKLDLWQYSIGGKVQQHVELTQVAAYQGQLQWNVESLLGAFFDVTNAYRFGPAKTDYYYARITKETEIECEAFYYPVEFGATTRTIEPQLNCEAFVVDEATVELVITSQQFARAVALNIYPYIAQDNYFDLPANGVKRIIANLPKLSKRGTLRGTITALNTLVIQPIAVIQKTQAI